MFQRQIAGQIASLVHVFAVNASDAGINCIHKICVVVCKTGSNLSNLKMAASRRVSMIPESFISFQMLILKIHERQSSCDTVFFPNIKITGTKDVSVVSWRFFSFFTESW